MSDMAGWKALARQTVHDAMSVVGQYQPAAGGAVTELRVRWHGQTIFPDAPAGYAQMVDTAETLVFDRGELAAYGLDPQRDDTVILPDYIRKNGAPLTLILKVREPYEGPVNLIWQVVRDI